MRPIKIICDGKTVSHETRRNTVVDLNRLDALEYMPIQTWTCPVCHEVGILPYDTEPALAIEHWSDHRAGAKTLVMA